MSTEIVQLISTLFIVALLLFTAYCFASALILEHQNRESLKNRWLSLPTFAAYLRSVSPCDNSESLHCEHCLSINLITHPYMGTKYRAVSCDNCKFPIPLYRID